MKWRGTIPCSAKSLYPLVHPKIAIDISIPNQSLSKGYGIYIYRSDSVGLSTESQYYYDKNIYFQVPKGFQRVYRYLYSAIPKSIIIWQYTVSCNSKGCVYCRNRIPRSIGSYIPRARKKGPFSGGWRRFGGLGAPWGGCGRSEPVEWGGWAG